VYNIVLQSWLPKVITKQLKASDTLDNLNQSKGTHYEIRYILSKEEDLISTLTPEAAEELIRKVILCLTGTYVYLYCYSPGQDENQEHDLLNKFITIHRCIMEIYEGKINMLCGDNLDYSIEATGINGSSTLSEQN
jgi:hypothetical protein